MAIQRADVCLIMIDATQGVTEQDTKVAGYAHENGKAAVIVVNKLSLIHILVTLPRILMVLLL